MAPVKSLRACLLHDFSYYVFIYIYRKEERELYILFCVRNGSIRKDIISQIISLYA